MHRNEGAVKEVGGARLFDAELLHELGVAAVHIREAVAVFAQVYRQRRKHSWGGS